MTTTWPQTRPWNVDYPSDVFGPLFMGDSVKEAALETMSLWTPTYVAEVNRQRGRQVVNVPLSYLYRADERPIRAGTSQLNVSVPTTVGEPTRQSGQYRVTWRLEVRWFFAGSQDWNESEAVAHAYAAVGIGALIQHSSLGGFAELTTWRGTNITSNVRSSTYSRVTCLTTFHVVVANSLSTQGGPAQPSVADPLAVPEVDAFEIKVDQLP